MMLIKSKASMDLSEAVVTPQSLYMNRRQFILAGTAFTALGVPSHARPESYKAPVWLRTQVQQAMQDNDTDETPTPYEYAASYNNFYEFGTGKSDPRRHAKEFVTDPWSVEIDGEVARPGRLNLEDILKPHVLEERIYRLRCVEAWSMVIPWIGFSLGKLLSRFEPTSRARYVKFTTLLDPEQMPGQRSFFAAIDYPYVEGLRMDEAMHPLTLLAVGMYGDTLPPQNGAPLRLVVPWKYGFKSIKSIVKIELTESMPTTTWVKSAPNEYGFFANVNPAVDHPRWSQKKERRLPGSFFQSNLIPTLPFNGYGDQVASLYAGMDLRRYF